MSSSLIQLIVTLIILGVLLWVVETLIPMDLVFKRLIEVVAVIGCLLYMLRAFRTDGPSGPI